MAVRDAEVDHEGRLRGDEHIARLDVAVHPDMGVEFGEYVGELGGQPQQGRCRESAESVDESLKAGARNVAGREPGPPSPLALAHQLGNQAVLEPT